MMNDFTTEELKEILETMDCTSENLDSAYDKIEKELERRKELAELEFEDDCLSCKL